MGQHLDRWNSLDSETKNLIKFLTEQSEPKHRHRSIASGVAYMRRTIKKQPISLLRKVAGLTYENTKTKNQINEITSNSHG